MTRYFALFLSVWFAALLAHADTLEDQYVQAFTLIQQADQLSDSEPKQAMDKYLQAQTVLQNIQKANSSWNPSVVSFRLDYIAGKMANLNSKLPTPQPAPTTNAPDATATAPTTVAQPPPAQPAPPPKPTAPDDWEVQLNALKEQVQQLQSDNTNLKSKLKEAFSVQSAGADPAELGRANEKLKAAQKENELLKASLQQTKTAPAVDPSAGPLAEANRQLAEQKDIATKLQLEKDALQSRLRSVQPSADKMAALQNENELLKKQLAQLQSAPASTASPDDAPRQLALAATQLAALQSERDLLKTQNAALAERLKAPSGPTVTSSVPPTESARIKELERENRDLQKRLDQANKTLYGRKGKALNARIEDLRQQLDVAHARLEAFEARSIPYTTEELSLLQHPEPKTVTTPADVGVKSVRQLSPASAHLVADARHYYASGQYDQAEAAYLQVLHEDDKSVPVLADLASIELRAGRIDSAETNILRALEVAPDSAYALSVLGRLRFRQNRFDDSLDALTRAAKLEPENAEFQNFLGLVLSHKGQRGPAETAFRKAIQIDASFANAHCNLAMVYASSQPPAMELAHWHYKKALELGAPHDPELEKLLNQRSASINSIPEGPPRRRFQ